MAFLPPGGNVSTANSTSTPLSGGATFTGTSEDITNYSAIFVNVFADVASGTDGLSVEQSSDGTNWDNTDSYTIPAGTGKNFSINPNSQFFRVVYTNGAGAQSSFRLQTVYKNQNAKPSSHRVEDEVIGDDDCELNKTALTGPDGLGDWHNVKASAAGSLLTADFVLEVRKGNVPGHGIMFGMGEFESGNVDVAGEDVCRWEDVGGPSRLPTPPAIGEQMTVISSDNADNGATATGALTVRLYYLDATGAEQTEDITMNGTTGVNTVATDIRFINDMHTLTVGSNGVAEGNITLYTQGGSIANNLYNFIVAGGNKSLVPHRMVPNGKTLYLQDWHCEEAQDKRCAFRIRSTDMYGTLFPGVFCFKDSCYMSNSSSGSLHLHNVEVPALSIIKVSHWDDVAGAEGSCGWWGITVDDNI